MIILAPDAAYMVTMENTGCCTLVVSHVPAVTLGDTMLDLATLGD